MSETDGRGVGAPRSGGGRGWGPARDGDAAEAWRPLPEEPDPASGPRPVRHSLDRVTRALGGPEATVLAAVFGHWEEIVGPAVAAHSRPVSVSNGTLVVAVDQPGWATQLTYLEGDLRRRIGEVSGVDVVRRVRVTVRPGEPPGWYPGSSG